MKTLKKAIGSFIWNFCELHNIRLGMLAPKIFGWMVGSNGKRIE